jgi:predicted glycosyltransferase
MKVWIDLANSPHPLLFAPVSRELSRRGHEVVVTARDNAQTVELTAQLFPDAEIIGEESPSSRLGKAGALLRRAENLRRWSKSQRADVALSHNSYSQIVVARSAGLRVVTAMDFEHQPANHVGFRGAHTILLPEAIAHVDVRAQGARRKKVRRYPGLKEQLYLSDFRFNPSVAADVGVPRSESRVLVVARTPPSRATYHRFQNNVFDAAIATACGQPNVFCVILPRHAEQRAQLRQLERPNCLIVDHALDSRSLMYSADLVLGAGGTMTREAALMGVPTYTLFEGKTPAVDRWLMERGLLLKLTEAEQLVPLKRRAHEPVTLTELRRQAEPIMQRFVSATLGEDDRVPLAPAERRFGG